MKIVFNKVMHGFFFRLASLLFTLISISAGFHGQSTSRSLSGRVADSAGGGVAGAEALLTGVDTRFRLNVKVDQDGTFRFNSLQSGEYELRVSAASFADQRVRIRIPEQSKVELTLQPRPLAAEVSVAAGTLAGTEASLSDIPGSIDRLDAHSLISSRVLNFSEALRKISGVNVRDEEGFGLRPNIGIRGTNPTRSMKVLLLEDGVPLAYAPYGDNASYYHPPVERYESIEVLKGSGQIAYGPQTIAGLINYLTPLPTTEPTFGVRLTGGNRGFFNGSFTGSGTLKKTGIYSNFTRKQGDGSRENTNSKLNDVLVKVTQTINDRNVVALKFSYYGEDSNVTYSGLTTTEYVADPRANPFANDFFFGDRFGFMGAHSGVVNSKVAVTTTFYANKFKRHWWRQSSNSVQRPNRLNLDPDCRSMADLSTTCGNEGRLREYETYGVEPRFTFNYDAGKRFRGELQAGVRGHWEVQKRRQENGDLPTSRTGVAVEINERRNAAYSAFVQNRFIFGNLAITPGIRFESIDAERRNRLVSPIAEGRATIMEAIPGIGIAYSGLPKTTVFAGVHRGFSPPRTEDIISTSGGVVELNSELSWNYEAGVRSHPVKGLRLEATFFRLDYENQIVPASLAGGVGATLTNGGKTLQKGFEFSGQFDSGLMFASRHNFYIHTAYTWLPVAEFQGIRYSSVNPMVTVTGNRLPYVPGTLATTSLGYSHTNGFDAFVENVYISRQFGDDLNTVDPNLSGQRGAIPAQTYWNATANYKVEKWKTTFFVTAKNLLDRTLIVDRSRGVLPSGPRLLQAGVHIRF